MIQPRYVIEVTRETRDFINELAAELTRQGPGTFGQKQAADYLVRCHKDAIGRLDAALAAEVRGPLDGVNERTGIAWNE